MIARETHRGGARRMHECSVRIWSRTAQRWPSPSVYIYIPIYSSFIYINGLRNEDAGRAHSQFNWCINQLCDSRMCSRRSLHRKKEVYADVCVCVCICVGQNFFCICTCVVCMYVHLVFSAALRHQASKSTIVRLIHFFCAYDVQLAYMLRSSVYVHPWASVCVYVCVYNAWINIDSCLTIAQSEKSLQWRRR